MSDQGRFPGGRDPWLYVRLFGWGLIVVWQLLGLVQIYLPSEKQTLQVAGRLVAISGIALVAWGFERLNKHNAQRFERLGA